MLTSAKLKFDVVYDQRLDDSYVTSYTISALAIRAVIFVVVVVVCFVLFCFVLSVPRVG